MASLEKIQFIADNTPVFSSEAFQLDNAAAFIEWIVRLETIYKVLGVDLKAAEATAWAQLRLSGKLQVWASCQEFTSWQDFKYAIFNQLYPLRTDLRWFVLPQVNEIKALLDGEQARLFSTVKNFYYQINQLYQIVEPFEDVEHLKHLSSNVIPSLLVELRKITITKYQLYLKPEEELTEEEEELYLDGSDAESKQFWAKFEPELKALLYESQVFALAVSGTTKKIQDVKITRIAYKIVKNL